MTPGDGGAPLRFSATFPCDARFRPAVADLGVKVARSLGYPDDDAREIGTSIHQAFERAVAGGGGGQVFVDVTLRADGTALDAVVRCSTGVVLELTRPRAN